MRFKTEPYKHQKNILARFINQPYFALFMEMGTGKTKVVLDWLTVNIEEYGRAVVFAPKSAVINWGDEIEKHSWLSYKLLLGSTIKKKKLLQEGLREGKQVFVTNYEAVLTLYDDFVSYFNIVILDESTYIKNPWAKRTKLLIKMGDMLPVRIIMSGLPITNTPLDIWSQFRFLDRGLRFGKSFLSFRNKYFYSDYNKWHWYPKKGSLEKINQKIYEVAARVEKKDCLDLPEKIYERRYVELPPKIRRIYDQIRLLLRAEIEGDKSLTVREAIVKTLRLVQIASGIIPTDQGILKYSGHKLKALEEIIEENPSEKMIIWCYFKPEVYLLQRFMNKKKYNFVTIYGDTKDKERREAYHSFQNSPDVKYMIAEVKTAGMALTLTASHISVYYSNTFSLEARKQSEDRTHRIGQNEKPVYIDIIAKDTIDEYILKVLQKKKKVADITLKNLIEEVL